MNAARAVWRLSRGVLHALGGALTCALVFPFMTPQRRMRRVGAWSAQMLRVLGIELRTSGMAQSAPVLFVANHVSWLDILAINAVHPARFVSKADVRHWPLIGYMVASGGTLFIERERKRDALRVVHQVAQALKDGDVVAVFPEGTTSDGHGLLPFHANLLQAAISTGVPVQAMALRFSDRTAAVSAAAAYIGDMTLARSAWQVVSAQGLRADVQLLPPVATAGVERRVLAEQLSEQVAGALRRTSKPTTTGSPTASVR